MKFAIPKNVRLGLIGQTGRPAQKLVEEEQEIRCENVCFQNQEALKHCVLEKRKSRKSAI